MPADPPLNRGRVPRSLVTCPQDPPEPEPCTSKEIETTCPGNKVKAPRYAPYQAAAAEEEEDEALVRRRERKKRRDLRHLRIIEQRVFGKDRDRKELSLKRTATGLGRNID